MPHTSITTVHFRSPARFSGGGFCDTPESPSTYPTPARSPPQQIIHGSDTLTRQEIYVLGLGRSNLRTGIEALVATRSQEPALHILFVCTGNVCRSPTAERLATHYGARSHIRDFTVSSAGTHAMIGHPVQPSAARVLMRLGGDPSDFAARQITPRLVGGADLVLTMTRAHRDDVLGLVPQGLHRTFTLIEACLLYTSDAADE